jgi:hypothetical protein
MSRVTRTVSPYHGAASYYNLTAQAETALAHGELKLRRLDPSLPPASARNITIRFAEQDLWRARDLATKRGLRYQTYLKMLLHEALDNEEERPAS